MKRSRIRLFNQSRNDVNVATAERATVVKDRTQLFNQLTLLLLVLALIMLACYATIYLFPDSGLNLFKPVSLSAVFTPAPTSTHTATPTPTETPWPTNTATAEPTATATPLPTDTPAPTETPAPTIRGQKGTRVPPTPTSTRTPTPTVTPAVTKSPFNYTAEVIYQRHQLYGVNWAGIAGLVLGTDLKYQANISVHAWGDEPLGPQGKILPSGIEPAYGPSGWEFKLDNKPAIGKWKIQLVNADGSPLSDVIDIEMRGDPLANLAYVIFTQNH